MIINDLFNNKKFVAEEESEAAAQRKQYPSYYQHRDAGTVFRTQNDVGQTMNITPDDEEWDDYYRQQFPDMPTPNDGGFWSDDNTAAMVEGMSGNVVFSGTGANGGTYEIIQSSPTDFMIHANGRHIDTYGSLQRAMSVLKNEVPGLQQGMAEAGFPGAPDVEMPPMKPSGDPERDKLKNEYVDLHREIKSLVDAAYGGNKRAKARIAQLNDRADQIRAILEPRQPPNEWQKKTYGYDDNWNIVKKGVAENNAVNVPPGQQATTQPDGSTRISKPGSVSRADYAKNMAAYKAQTQTPEKIADFKQRMASGQGYTDTERQANLQQQQQHFGKYADTGDLDEGDGFDVVSNYQNMRTTDTGNKSNQTYTSTAIAKNPATGQQKSLASWDHTDPKTGKNYSGSNYIDAQGNAEVQKNYEESKNKVNEVSLGDYRKKATVNKALAQTNKFFGRDDPAKVAAADQTIAKRERGLGRADARGRPYTAPPVDQAKQRRDLADKYPNIDELVRQAELNRDPDYEYADGQAYYAGRDAEHNYHRLKQIQRMIRGAELDEMDFGGVGQVTDSDTGDVTTSFNQGPVSVSQTKTPGGYTKQTDQQFNLGTATLGARTVGPNIGAGQLAGTTTKTATNTATGQAKQQVKGVGFGGASGATVGKNYVGSSDDELAKHAADSFIGTNESVNRMKHLAGIKPAK